MVDPAPAPADTAPPATPAPAPQAGVSDFKTSLPEDIRAHPSLEKYTTLEALAKGYINSSAMIGADKVVIPKEGDEEGWNEAFKKLGRPDTPDKYEFKRPEMPEGVKYDEDSEKWFRGEAHKNGLLPKQAQALFNAEIARRLDQYSSYEKTNKEQIAASVQALKKEFGDAYDGALTTADTALREYGGEEFLEVLKQAGVAHHPSTIKAFNKIGRDLIGAGKLKGAGDGSPTPAEAKQRAAAYRTQYKAVLEDKMHPEYQSRFAEYTRLNEQAFGKEPWMA